MAMYTVRQRLLHHNKANDSYTQLTGTVIFTRIDTFCPVNSLNDLLYFDDHVIAHGVNLS